MGLSSPSIARNFERLLSDAARSQLGKSIKLVSISPVTSQAALEAGLQIDAEAKDYHWDGIFAAIQEYRSLHS